MSDLNDPVQPSATTPGAAHDAHASALQRRRRLLKIGAGAVPTALTLTSRPVMAWHCNSTSAWGSAQGVNPLASSVARAKSTEVADECWYISEWKDPKNATPWDRLDAATGVKYCRAVYTMNQLFSGRLPVDCSSYGAMKVWAVLSDSAKCKPRSFTEAMIVARLNYRTNAGVRTCLNPTSSATDELSKMATGLYKVPGTQTVWDKDAIMKYLALNWAAV